MALMVVLAGSGWIYSHSDRGIAGLDEFGLTLQVNNGKAHLETSVIRHYFDFLIKQNAVTIADIVQSYTRAFFFIDFLLKRITDREFAILNLNRNRKWS